MPYRPRLMRGWKAARVRQMPKVRWEVKQARGSFAESAVRWQRGEARYISRGEQAPWRNRIGPRYARLKPACRATRLPDRWASGGGRVPACGELHAHTGDEMPTHPLSRRQPGRRHDQTARLPLNLRSAPEARAKPLL